MFKAHISASLKKFHVEYFSIKAFWRYGCFKLLFTNTDSVANQITNKYLKYFPPILFNIFGTFSFLLRRIKSIFSLSNKYNARGKHPGNHHV